jgi:membrane associated rhomboid family serine protease
MFPIGDTIPARNPSIAVWALILANGLIFVVESMMPEAQQERLFYLFGIVPARFTHPAWAMWAGLPVDDYWPFLTSMFIHGSPVHLVANMWTLWIFGDNVEDRMGPVRFTVFYILCGLAAGVVHWFVNPSSTVPAVGASGAIAGILAAYFVLFPYSRVIVLVPLLFVPLFFAVPAVTYIGFWTLAQLFSGTLALASPYDVGGIAWWAHVGGFAAGLGLLAFFVRHGQTDRRPSRDEYGIDVAWQWPGHWGTR